VPLRLGGNIGAKKFKIVQVSLYGLTIICFISPGAFASIGLLHKTFDPCDAIQHLL
jgi:hypothetical protein